MSHTWCRYVRNVLVMVVVLLGTAQLVEAKVSVSILGAPASGKSYYYKKFIDKDWEAVKVAQILTVDILRDDFLKAPLNIKLYEMFKTKDFVKSLNNEDPTQFGGWVKDYDNTMQSVAKTINTITDRHIAVVNLTDRFLFTLDNDEITIYGLLSYLDRNEHAKEREQLEEKIFGAKHAYNNLKRIVRNLQYAALKSATVVKKNVVFDETGDELPKLLHKLEILKESDYDNLVIMIHPKSVLINYMQNASRMVLGTDGGRDSSYAIADSYKKIDVFCGGFCEDNAGKGVTYPGVSLQASYIELNENVNADEAVDQALDHISRLHKGEQRGAKIDKPIDYLLWLTPSDIAGTIKRIGGSLDESQTNVWKAILKLHLENGDKTDATEIEKLKKMDGEVGAFYQELVAMKPKTAIELLKEAQTANEKGGGKRYAGVTNQVLDEAKKVWPKD